MPTWVLFVAGAVVVLAGVARLYAARSLRKTTLPWDRRQLHDNDFSTRSEPYDQSKTDRAWGIGLIVLGVVIVVGGLLRH